MKKFITYAIGPTGQEFGPDLDFAPLPKQVVAAGKKAIAKIGSELGGGRRPQATRFCGPGATAPTASATRCCEASPASQRRSPSRSSPASSTRSSTSPGRRSANSASGSSPPTTGTRSPKSFGAAPFLYGTVVTSFIALLFAAPLSIAISIYLTELAPKRVRRPVATLIDMLAAIPTVILGLWGILVLGPFMRDTIEPALHSVLGFLPIFERRPLGLRLPDGRRGADDHGDADHHQRHPRGLRDRSRRPQGGLLRARRDPLGDGPAGRPALLEIRASSAPRSSASAARSARRSPSPR